MAGELILLVDDEPNIRQLARLYLERDGFHVEEAGDGNDALALVTRLKPALIVLDLMLPEVDGWEVCRRLNLEGNPAAIIMLTARDDDIDKTLGLELGADDYMTKPFNPRELVARVKAILRRRERPAYQDEKPIYLGDLVVDLARHEVNRYGEYIDLRSQEFDLLVILARNKGLVLSREKLLELAWGFDFYGQTRTVDVHIGHLRKKLAGSQVQNEMGAKVGASQQSQRDFVLQVSHELKTPLTSIQGFAQAILDGTASTSLELQQAAGVIYDEAGRMHRMVLELLDLARLDSGIATMERVPVDICVLLRAIEEKLAPQAREAHIDIQLDLLTVPPVLGDADRLAQVFTNLLDNAIKFTPGGETVFVQTGMDSHYVEVAIQDHGPGIPPEDLERIFDRFYQSDKSRRGGSGHGVGLGLPIAREIVNSHGGSLTVKNNSLDSVGPGCSFLVRLPSAPPGETSGFQKSSVNNAG